ncbi:MAG TPA: stomatin-like protein [Candidatus Angelobacter sp.]|nr:stomatin-like protein [Candidatus Angelobacter sp.]
MFDSSGLLVGVVAVFAAMLIVLKSLKIVPQQSAWIVERLGRYHATLGAGLNIITPFVDRVAYKHNLREIPMEVQPQVCITKDNTQVTVDGILYYQVTDAKLASYGSSSYTLAITQLAQTTLRSAIGTMDLDQVLSSRATINAEIVQALDEAGITWGVKVLRYEIRDITPPQAIIRAMELQITADRERRATIAKSEGDRTQQINIAEGQRQAEINRSEGEQQAAINRATGQAQAIELVAKATANAIQAIAEMVSKPGGMEALQLQVAKDYVNQFGNIAKESTTVLLPANLAELGSMVETALQIVRSDGKGALLASKAAAAGAPVTK